MISLDRDGHQALTNAIKAAQPWIEVRAKKQAEATLKRRSRAKRVKQTRQARPAQQLRSHLLNLSDI